MKWLYFDNNATTQPLPEVVEAMLPWLHSQFGNPSSSHPLGRQAREALVNARAVLASFVHATPGEVMFTSGATESNHWAIQAALAAQPLRRQIVTSQVEHSATLKYLAYLETQGYTVLKLPVNAQGGMALDAVRQVVGPDTALVSIMHANHETGVMFPVAEIAEIAHAHGALMHVDAAQTAGKLALDVQALGCDFLGFSAHKLYGPKGTGMLYARKGLSVQPMLWGAQERHRRGGTENLSAIVGFAAACEWLKQEMPLRMPQVASLRDRFESVLTQTFPQVQINGGGARVGNTSNLCFAGIHEALNGEELLMRLEKKGVIASRGSACSAGGNQPSHVLLALGLSEVQALASLRFSLGLMTSEYEIQALLTALITVLEHMQAPYQTEESMLKGIV